MYNVIWLSIILPDYQMYNSQKECTRLSRVWTVSRYVHVVVGGPLPQNDILVTNPLSTFFLCGNQISANNPIRIPT
jgi:hypothetical protein